MLHDVQQHFQIRKPCWRDKASGDFLLAAKLRLRIA
jgi:hypothetical protein